MITKIRRTHAQWTCAIDVADLVDRKWQPAIKSRVRGLASPASGHAHPAVTSRHYVTDDQADTWHVAIKATWPRTWQCHAVALINRSMDVEFS